MLAFIRNSGVFNLGADHISYLNELGVSSRVIGAMLLHDRDLMPDPIKSSVTDELDAQPAVITAHGDDGDSVIKPGDSSAIPLTTAMANATDGKNLPETDQSFLAAPVASAQKSELVGPPAPNQQPSPQKGRTLYPVRAPYPVELTAPIVFLDAPSF